MNNINKASERKRMTQLIHRLLEGGNQEMVDASFQEEDANGYTCLHIAAYCLSPMAFQAVVGMLTRDALSQIMLEERGESLLT